jgi:hypothetical protein
MGKASGERKARSPELARKAALARWARKGKAETKELAQEKHRRKFVQPLKKKPVRRKKKIS